MTKPMRVDGADLSHHNPDPNLPVAAKAGLKFLYHKALEGTSAKDDQYNERRAAAAKAGVAFGAYHFASPDGGDAVAEARAFLDLAKPKPGDLIPCLDFEQMGKLRSKAEAMVWAGNFSNVIQKALGVVPVLYGPWDLQPGKAVRWVPRYNNDNRPPVEGGWDIWQFSNGVYGVPNSFVGLGHVDLNTFAKGMTMGRLRIPMPAKDVVDVPMWHCSMQFSDNDAQQASDAKKIFKAARARGVWWLTGTEAGAGSNLAKYLNAEAGDNGYRFWRDNTTDAWYAIDRGRIDGGWETWTGPIVVKGDAGHNTAKRPTSVEFDNKTLGHIGLQAAHYMTKGRPDAPASQSVFLKENMALAEAIGARARILGAGASLTWYGGDQNIVDRTSDTFFGEPLTSCWDELERWENTGHGNIDVIASYDRDGRVVCKSARALDDSEFKLNTDHFLVEAVYSVTVG